jgi:hypothetical protein
MARRAGVLAILLGLGVCVGLGVVTQSSGCVDESVFNDGSVLVDGGFPEGGMNALESLRITPEDAVLTLDGNKAVTQAYKAIGKFKDGAERDVTAETSFSVDDARVGIFVGNVFNSVLGWGGSTTVVATAGNGVTATTSLTVVYKRRFVVGTDVPADTASKFEGAPEDVSSPPKLAYPPDGVLVPPNLVDLEIQWEPAAGQSIFEVSFTNTGTDIRVYTKCNAIGSSGCGYIPGAAEWKALVGALKGYDPAEVMVRGAPADISKAASSHANKLSIAEEDIKGGLYYWNATPGVIVRYDFGKSGQKATNFYTAADAKALFCVGCHALSLDGKRMAVGLDMPAPAPLKILDVPTRQVLASGFANFMAFSPDGKMIITSDGNSMVLRDTDTLTALDPNPLVAKGSLPDWSPDGTKVVYSEPAVVMPLPFGNPGIQKGSLKLLNYDAAQNKWSAPVTLIQQSGSENNYYPTFSPDNELIIFNRSASDSYDAPDASLWVIRNKAGAKPAELKLANGGSNLCNSWPKFSPFIQTYQGRQILWFTFSSRRDYGLRLAGKAQAQLWMAAIDLTKDEMSTDPSYPAFWLPFQNINTGNHIAQWTKEVVKKPCGLDGDCPPNEVCINGMCEPQQP